jgi:uncharacterized BrkB/YihY/UPF0761 family membrane protein
MNWRKAIPWAVGAALFLLAVGLTMLVPQEVLIEMQESDIQPTMGTPLLAVLPLLLLLALVFAAISLVLKVVDKHRRFEEEDNQ